MTKTLTWSTNLYLILAVVLAIIAIIVTWRLLKLMWRVVDQSLLAGVTPKARWISLGITSLFGSSLLIATAQLFQAWINLLVFTIPTTLYANWQRAYEACGKPDAVSSRCIGEFAFAQLSGWSASINEFLRTNAAFPIAWLVVFLAAWCLLANLLSLRETAGEGESIWIVRAFGRMSHAARMNIVLFALLGVAVYLSMAAIAAVPGLQEKTVLGDEVSSERLRQQLEAAATSVPDIKPLVENNPFEKIEQALNAPAGPLPAPEPQPQPQPVTTSGNQPASAAPTPADIRRWQETELRTTLNASRWWRDNYTSALKKLVQSASKDSKSALEQAVTAYTVAEKTRKGSRQQADYFVAIMAWYERGASSFDRQLHDCTAVIADGDHAARTWSDRAAQSYMGNEQSVAEAEAREMFNRYQAANPCHAFTSFGPVPVRPALGSNLGPFRYLASWLLDTESLALVLIVGMFGFGLLGSACSTFVREKGTKDERGPLVKDLGGVVIRGLSAAIVVFLAVEGGLAIFGSSGGEPNPYVLLFTCLVGAVFSESIWDWAQQRLLSGFSKEGRKPEDKRVDDQGKSDIGGDAAPAPVTSG